jgi:hypothetical protein
MKINPSPFSTFSHNALGALKMLPGGPTALATGKQRRFAHKHIHLMVE